MNGIDISQWQGDMDLTPYKDGFVIIRGGFWTSTDPWAERNIAKCEKLGIPWGLYWYSYALNVPSAKLEADLCLRFLNGRKPRLGVWFDMEDADGYKQKNGFPENETITAMCKTFCAAMKDAGNKTGVYASLSWFDTHIGETGYDRWIARGARTTAYIIPSFPDSASCSSTGAARWIWIFCMCRFRILTMARRAEQSPAPTKRKE